MASHLRAISAAPTAQDFALVEQKLRTITASGINRSLAFARYVCDQVFGIDPNEIDEHITDGADDRGIDIVYIDSENHRINIGSCKCVADYRKAKKNFPGKEVDKIITFVDDLLKRNETILLEANGKLSAAVREIWGLFDEGEVFQIHIHLFSNQMPLADPERKRLNSFLTKYGSYFSEHSLYELSHGVVRAKKASFKKRIRPEKLDAYSISGTDFRGIQFSAPLHEVAKFATIGTKKEFDHRILEQNVRYFLGLDNIVNKGIRETLTSGRGDTFWALNNGITIVCEQYLLMPGLGNPITMKNPVVVNGGQTIKVIHDVATNTLTGCPSGSINVKVVESNDPKFIEKIALASNTQSRIYGRDLRAHDLVQEKLAAAISDYGYYYRRKRGEYDIDGDRKIIDMLRTGQLLLAYSAGNPVKSKTNSNDLFDELYEEAFDQATLSAELVICVHKLFERLQIDRNAARAWQRSVARNSYSESWILEGYFHVLYCLGLLLKRRGIPLHDQDKALSFFDLAKDMVKIFVEKHPSESAYRIFRSSTSVAELRRIVEEADTTGVVSGVQLKFQL